MREKVRSSLGYVWIFTYESGLFNDRTVVVTVKAFIIMSKLFLWFCRIISVLFLCNKIRGRIKHKMMIIKAIKIDEFNMVSLDYSDWKVMLSGWGWTNSNSRVFLRPSLRE